MIKRMSEENDRLFTFKIVANRQDPPNELQSNGIRWRIGAVLRNATTNEKQRQRNSITTEDKTTGRNHPTTMLHPLNLECLLLQITKVPSTTLDLPPPVKYADASDSNQQLVTHWFYSHSLIRTLFDKSSQAHMTNSQRTHPSTHFEVMKDQCEIHTSFVSLHHHHKTIDRQPNSSSGSLNALLWIDFHWYLTLTLRLFFEIYQSSFVPVLRSQSSWIRLPTVGSQNSWQITEEITTTTNSRRENHLSTTTSEHRYSLIFAYQETMAYKAINLAVSLWEWAVDTTSSSISWRMGQVLRSSSSSFERYSFDCWITKQWTTRISLGEKRQPRGLLVNWNILRRIIAFIVLIRRFQLNVDAYIREPLMFIFSHFLFFFIFPTLPWSSIPSNFDDS